jgi:hypothetical protein
VPFHQLQSHQQAARGGYENADGIDQVLKIGVLFLCRPRKVFTLQTARDVAHRVPPSPSGGARNNHRPSNSVRRPD